MGLDMYLEGHTFNWTDWDHPENAPKRDGFKIKGIILELGYWRKHPNLHGYIIKTFANNVDDCQKIPLSSDNIKDIIKAIKEKRLSHTEGFFFGQSQPEDDLRSIEIFEKALAWLEGETPPRQEPLQEIGGGLAVMALKPENFVNARESRDVIYQASW